MPKINSPKTLAKQIKRDGGADAFRKRCEPALKAQPKPNMERRPKG